MIIIPNSLSLEGPLTEAERKKLRSILNNPKALDEVIDKALKGWGGRPRPRSRKD